MGIINIAVVVSGLDEEYQYNIIRGINQYARERKINVSYFAAFGGMVDSRRFDIGEYSIYSLTDFTKFDGALVMTNTFGDAKIRGRIMDRVRAAGIPAVVFETKDYPDFHDISIDNFSVMKALVNHVIQKHGAKILNFVSGPLANPEGRARYNAFLSAMRDNKLKIEEARIYPGSFRSYDGIRAVEDFVASGLPMPDAIICSNDSMALTVISSLEKLGYRVPDDIIVTGFDNTSNARNSFPALTTVSRPLFDSGYQAMEILCKLLNGTEQPVSTVLDATPVFSESCGCTAEHSDNLGEYTKSAYRRMETTNTNIHMLNRLTAGLAEAETADECFDAIESVIKDLGCEKFCLCLTKDWESSFQAGTPLPDPSDYAERMTAPLIWDRGRRRSVALFPSSNMFPEPFETGGNVSYFLPLHFGERCLGYYIITNSDFPISSLICHTLTLTLSNSVENIRKLFHINNAMNELNRLYVIDPLCNIYNRNGFFNIADDMFRDSIAQHRRVMLSFIDMDGLKYINDNYGHNEGDFAIQRLAGVIQDCCNKNSICARFGGDEFLILSVNVDRNDDIALAKKFAGALQAVNDLIRKPYVVSASLGSVVILAEEGDSLYSIIKQADEKMYEIKKQKKRARRSEKI